MKKLLVLSMLLITGNSTFAQSKKIVAAKLRPFIPKDYSVLAYGTGDLNQDTYPDVVLALKATTKLIAPKRQGRC